MLLFIRILGLSTSNKQAIADMQGYGIMSEQPDNFAEDFLSDSFSDEQDDSADPSAGSSQVSDNSISAKESITYTICDILDGQYVFIFTRVYTLAHCYVAISFV